MESLGNPFSSVLFSLLDIKTRAGTGELEQWVGSQGRAEVTGGRDRMESQRLTGEPGRPVSLQHRRCALELPSGWRGGGVPSPRSPSSDQEAGGRPLASTLLSDHRSAGSVGHAVHSLCAASFRHSCCRHPCCLLPLSLQ